MPRNTESYYSSHEALLQEEKAFNTYRDYRQKRTGRTYAQKQKNPTHKFSTKTYQHTTNSNESVILEKKGKEFWTVTSNKKPVATRS